MANRDVTSEKLKDWRLTIRVHLHGLPPVLKDMKLYRSTGKHSMAINEMQVVIGLLTDIVDKMYDEDYLTRP